MRESSSHYIMDVPDHIEHVAAKANLDNKNVMLSAVEMFDFE